MTTRRLGLASIRASRSWRSSNILAPTMLRGGLSNTTLQYAGVSSMMRRCAVDSLMILAPFPLLPARRQRRELLLAEGGAGDSPSAFCSLGEQNPGAARLRGVAGDLRDDLRDLGHQLLLTRPVEHARWREHLHPHRARLAGRRVHRARRHPVNVRAGVVQVGRSRFL